MNVGHQMHTFLMSHLYLYAVSSAISTDCELVALQLKNRTAIGVENTRYMSFIYQKVPTKS